MAFTLEDGSGIEDANAYLTTAEADEYFADRAIIAWTGNDAVKQVAIITATDFVEKRFGLQFGGSKEFQTVGDELQPQSLSFPRIQLFYPSTSVLVTGIPRDLKFAVAEYALRSLTISLMPDPIRDDTGGEVTRKREKIGPIEDETVYLPGLNNIPSYPAADRLLTKFLSGGASGGGVIR